MKKIIAIIIALVVTCSAVDEIRRPTTDQDNSTPNTWCGNAQPLMKYIDGGTGPNNVYPLAYDFEVLPATTHSEFSANGETVMGVYADRMFTGWQNPSGAYTSLALTVDSQCVENYASAPNTYHSKCATYWNDDFSNNWNLIGGAPGIETAGSARSLKNQTIPAGTNLANVRVIGCVGSFSDTGHGSSAQLTIYDVRSTGTLAGGTVNRKRRPAMWR